MSVTMPAPMSSPAQISANAVAVCANAVDAIFNRSWSASARGTSRTPNATITIRFQTYIVA